MKKNQKARVQAIKSIHRNQIKNQKRSEKKEQQKLRDNAVKIKLLGDLFKTMFHYFPNILEKIDQIEEIRKRPQYKIGEIIFAAIALHIFKATTRNSFNNMRNEKYFEINYFKTFGLRLPHFDTVNAVLELLNNDELEKLKVEMVTSLIEKKIFYKFKILFKFYNIVFDGTGVMTIDEANVKNFPNALHKTSKNGVVTYFINVLEAKLVCRNGLAISIGTEWIENENEYDKQDCEQKAFIRLAEKIKKNYPRLPICVVADGLYPNKTIFSECKRYGWEFIFTFKEGNLKKVWEKVNKLKTLLTDEERKTIIDSISGRIPVDGKIVPSIISQRIEYLWINDLSYGEFLLSFIEMNKIVNEKMVNKFVYISSLKADNLNICELVENGRIRFKIENEGFNTQKNLGYGLSHKFSRTSMNAVKNYYSCLQIGHIINQLFECRNDVELLIKGRETLKSFWKFVVGQFCFNDLGEVLDGLLSVNIKIQVRLAS